MMNFSEKTGNLFSNPDNEEESQIDLHMISDDFIKFYSNNLIINGNSKEFFINDYCVNHYSENNCFESINYYLKNENNINNNNKIFRVLKRENLEKNRDNKHDYIYRKDAYYKHFKSLFARFIKHNANTLKNICFPNYANNNFANISYRYTGNSKEKDNYLFLFFKIKDLLSYGKDCKIKNRHYNNEILIKVIEENEAKSINKNIYIKLINFINNSVENELINYYDNKIEYNKLINDPLCLFYDKHFKKETGFSLIEKYGFIKILKKRISNV